MKGNIFTKVEGKRGGMNYFEGGLTVVKLDNSDTSDNYIGVNAKEYNETTKKLEYVDHIIEIGKDGKTIFRGTFEELCAKLNNEFTKDEIDDYKEKITDSQTEELLTHCNKYDIAPTIIAWYENLDDLIGDYADFGYSKEETIDMMKLNEKMFCKFSNGEIVKLEY